MARNRPLVFISHAHEDAQVALALKESLEEAFLGYFSVFTSTDGASIRAGDNWSSSIESALRNADLMLVLLSPEALNRRWIYFEAGGAYFAGKRVIPICCGELTIANVPTPLSWLQALRGYDAADVRRLITEIANLFELRPPGINAEMVATRLGHGLDSSADSSRKPTRIPDETPQLPVPVIVLYDASGSMAGERTQAVRQGLTQIVDQLRSASDPKFAFLVWLIAFGNGARVILDAIPAQEIRDIPEIPTQGGSDLGAALQLAAHILADPAASPSRGVRPILLTMADGEPTDDWQAGLTAFTSTAAGSVAVRICLAVGGDAPLDVLNTIGKDGVMSITVPTPASTLARVFASMGGQVVSSIFGF